MKKYNLTFLQRLELILVFPMWLLADPAKRKTWYEVKKGFEKHTCNFVIPHTEKYNGHSYLFYKCDHEGCNMVNPDEPAPANYKLN